MSSRELWTRRTMLRGAGAVLALPWMESLARATAGENTAPPRRLAFLFFPNGVLDQDWRPKQTGPDWTAPSALEPLLPHRHRVHLVNGLRNRNSFAGEGHYVKTTALLSGAKVRRTGGRDLACGTSVDQLAARELGDRTPTPSLVLGIDPVRNRVDMGYSTVYGANVSWRSPTQPATREIHPRQAFDRLFRASRHGGPLDGSVLDLILDEARDLRPRLGQRDRGKLEEYLESVRELERRMQRFSRRPLRGLPDEAPAEGRLPFVEHVEWMLDLIALAFRTDTTRIATFMFGNSVSNRDFSFLPDVQGGHHHFSHHENQAEKKRQYSAIVRWHVERFAGLLDRLAAAEEGEHDVLHHSCLVLASGIRDGNAHDPKDVPVVLAGGGGGRLATGAHHRFEPGPLCNLHRTLLDVFGLPVPRFGDSDRLLTELLRS